MSHAKARAIYPLSMYKRGKVDVGSSDRAGEE